MSKGVCNTNFSIALVDAGISRDLLDICDYEI